MLFTIGIGKEEAGQVTIQRIGRGWALTDFFVHLEFRGRGLGSKLIKKALAWSDRRGINLTLRIKAFGAGERLNKEQLMEFYKRYGFVSRGGNRMYRISHKRRSNVKDTKDVGGSGGHTLQLATGKTRASQASKGT